MPLPPHALLRLTLSGVRSSSIADRLPGDWKQAKHRTRRIGEAWLESGTSAVLLVPSALCPDASNLLIASERLAPGALVVRRLGPFRFDRRLLASLKPAGWRDA